MFDAMSEFLQRAPFGVFAFCFGIPVILTGAMAGAALWSWRNARALSSMTETTVDKLEAGPALATGKVVDGSTLRAPLSGRVCAWVESVVEESVVSSSGSGSDRKKSRSWSQIDKSVSERPIRFSWEGHDARVKPEGATVFHSGWSEWYGPASLPEDRNPTLYPGNVSIGGSGRFEVMSDPNRRFRYRERYIFPGDPLFVLGEARQGGGKSGAFEIGLAGGQPFLISTRSPSDIRAESALAVKGGLVMSLVFAVVSAGVLMGRFG